VLAVSNFTRSLIEQSFLGPQVETIGLAPCACSSAAARPCPANPVADGQTRLLTLARIHPRKGQLDVARALALLPAELRGQVIYQLAGTGDHAYLDQVRQTCRNAGVACETMGGISPESLAATYQQCDIYAMTSRSLPASVEGFGITYLEAGFHGKPVLGYRSGGAAEAVVDNETGLLVNEGDIPSLAAACRRLIADSSLRQTLGENGRRHAARFSWDTTARTVMQLLR
jgi:glycosyltransferase involved in cell wall biosynthesis